MEAWHDDHALGYCSHKDTNNRGTKQSSASCRQRVDKPNWLESQRVKEGEGKGKKKIGKGERGRDEGETERGKKRNG